MTKNGKYALGFALLTGVVGVSYVLADEPPPDFRAAKALKPAVSATAAPAPTSAAEDHAHMEGMKHGAQDMHGEMMRDHQMGMQTMPQKGMGGMGPKAGATAMPMKPAKGCCAGNGMKPAAKPKPKPKPMPSADKPMPMPMEHM
jgi:hypothetical protein